MSDFVEVVGAGSAEVVCDLVRIHLGANARSDSVAQAFAEANAAMDRMVAALRADGASDLQSSGLEVHPDHEGKGRARGFRASVGMRVTIHDVASAGTMLAAAVEAGGDASRVHSLRLLSSSTEQAQGLAREAAWSDAVAKAEHYAALAGRRLGRVLDISETGRQDGPSHMLAHAAAAGGDMEGGTRPIIATLAVRWQLED
jgi:uncharacterized protein YggE